MKKCCIIGHRTIKNIESIEEKTKNVIIDLIKNRDVDTFLFGSRSAFDNLCCKIAGDLKRIDKLNITRIKYLCNNEFGFLEEEKEHCDKLFLHFFKNGLNYYDDVKSFKRLDRSGKASYVERNKMLIDDADICLFYFEHKDKCQAEKYLLPRNSGTNIAYNYATKTKKEIINIADL